MSARERVTDHRDSPRSRDGDNTHGTARNDHHNASRHRHEASKRRHDDVSRSRYSDHYRSESSRLSRDGHSSKDHHSSRDRNRRSRSHEDYKKRHARHRSRSGDSHRHLSRHGSDKSPDPLRKTSSPKNDHGSSKTLTVPQFPSLTGTAIKHELGSIPVRATPTQLSAGPWQSGLPLATGKQQLDWEMTVLDSKQQPRYAPETATARRPGFGTVTANNRISLAVNYFKISVPNRKLYCYDIEIKPGTDKPVSSYQRGGRGWRGGRGGRGGHSSQGPNGNDKKFKAIDGKMKKELASDYNRQVLAMIRATEKKKNKPHGYDDIFYDPTNPNGIEYVYDGVKNFYTIKKLNGLDMETEKGKANVWKPPTPICLPPLDGGSGMRAQSTGLKFWIEIKFATEVDLNTINKFINGTQSEQPQDAFKAVDIIMRHGQTFDSVVLGKGLFPNASQPEVKLSGFKNLVFGHHQTMKSCAIGPALNIDRMSAVFYDCGPLVNIMALAMDMQPLAFIEMLAQNVNQPSNLSGRRGHFDQKRGNYGRKSLTDELAERLKGIKVSTNYGSYKRKFKLAKITPVAASFIEFQDAESKDGMTGVVDYFESKYQIAKDNMMKNLPCVEIGSSKRPVYIPITLLNVEPNQTVSCLKSHETIELIKHCSSQTTRSRFDVIKKSASHVVDCDHAKQTLSQFNLSMELEPVLVDGFILCHPTLIYGSKEPVEVEEADIGENIKIKTEDTKEYFKPSDGRWSLSDQHKVYRNGAVIDLYIVINFVRSLDRKMIDNFISRFVDVGNEIGMSVEQPDKIDYYKEYVRNQSNQGHQRNHTFDEGFKSALMHEYGFHDKKPNLILFIFDKKDDALYQDIKFACDVKFGITCQCISDRVIEATWNARHTCDSKSSDFTLISNILLKINTKFDGINNLISNIDMPSVVSERTMIIGADVTHPDTTNNKISTSIAAICSTYDENHWFYYPCIRVQYGYSEIIHDSKAMFDEIGDRYYKKNGYLPSNIIFYRDGVSRDGMFADVIDNEIKNMKEAFGCLSEEKLKVRTVPKVTFVVVQKRHHTRFMVTAKQECKNESKDEDSNLMEFSPKSSPGDQTPPDESPSLSDSSNKKPVKNKFAKGGNIFGGVTIDTKIIHPIDYDFFLCSQDCVQGTPRPAHYYVLLDENNISPDDLYRITFNLCHTYAPATRALSIPAPVQYAHLAAKRSRCHLIASQAERDAGVRIWQKTESEELKEKAKEINKIIYVDLPLKERMYFI